MLFRYDFIGDKLDLSRFKKQVKRHLIQYEAIDYSFYVFGYKIQVSINIFPDVSTNYIISFSIAELMRDNDGEISSYYSIRVTDDLRFKEFPDLTKYYSTTSQGDFKSNSIDEIVSVLSNFITIIYKINNLKAFL